MKVKEDKEELVDFETFEDICDFVSTMDKTLITTDDHFKCAVLLFAAAFHGADIEKLIQFTNYDPIFCRSVEDNLRKSKVWVGDKTECEWAEDDGGIFAFWMDVQVGLGILKRADGEDIADG